MISEVNIEFVSSKSSQEVFVQVAQLHKEEIRGGFLASFDIRFLTFLYKFLADSTYSFLAVATNDENKVCGFICGGIDTGKVMKRFVIKNFFRSLPYILTKICSLKNFKKIIETLFYPADQVNHQLPTPEILNFCVASNWQGRGVGKRLFFALTDRFKKLGIDEIKIVTGEHQQQAQKFYEKLSAQKKAEIEIHSGVKSLIYTYKIT